MFREWDRCAGTLSQIPVNSCVCRAGHRLLLTDRHVLLEEHIFSFRRHCVPFLLQISHNRIVPRSLRSKEWPADWLDCMKKYLRAGHFILSPHPRFCGPCIFLSSFLPSYSLFLLVAFGKFSVFTLGEKHIFRQAHSKKFDLESFEFETCSITV